MTPELPQGFAAAVRPITAVNVTDAAGLIAGEATIPTGDTLIPACRAMPALGKSFATVLMAQEIFGDCLPHVAIEAF